MGELTRIIIEQSDAPKMADSYLVNLSTSWLGLSFGANQSRKYMVSALLFNFYLS